MSNEEKHDHEHCGHEHSHAHDDHQCCHEEEHDCEGHDHGPLTHSGKKHKHHPNHLAKGILGAVWGAGLFVLSLVTLNIPMLAFYLVTAATTLVTLYLGKDAFIQGIKTLIQPKKPGAKRLSMNLLYTISTLAIIGVSIASLFIPGLPMLAEAAPLVLGFWHIGEAVEHSLKKKVQRNLAMSDLAPKKVSVEGFVEEKSVTELVPGNILILKKGDVIPANGICLADMTLHTKNINGAAFHRNFKKNQEVLAGTVVMQELVRIRVSARAQDSHLAQIDSHIKKANQQKAPIEEFTNKILKYFIPGLLITALASAIIIGLVFNPALAIVCAISVLVSACPCALSLVTPLAVKIGMKKAAENGIHFKDGKTLQSAAEVNTVVFDLNGTLTKGKPAVTAYKIHDKNLSNQHFFSYLKLLESHSSHPIAKIIKDFAVEKIFHEKEHKMSKPTPTRAGVEAIIDGTHFMIGNASKLAEAGIKIKSPTFGTIYLVRDKQIIGELCVKDPLRPDAKKIISDLQKSGKKVHLCTGADKKTAKAYAFELGIHRKNVRANCSNVAKTEYIKEQQRTAKVAMVGDSLNDANAINQSDFGIAIDSTLGNKFTQSQAGVVIQGNSLSSIATAFEIAKQTTRNIWQNLAISLTYNTSITLIAAGLLVAVGFALNPAIGIALMVLETALVLGNANRFKNQPVKPQLQHAANEDVIDNGISESTHKRLANLPRVHSSPDLACTLESSLESKPSVGFFSQKPVAIAESKNAVTLPRSLSLCSRSMS